jgi:hypothetical protein
MPSLLVVVFVVQLSVCFFDTIGSVAVNDLVNKISKDIRRGDRADQNFGLVMGRFQPAAHLSGQTVYRAAQTTAGVPQVPAGPERNEQPGRVRKVGNTAAPA